MAQARPLSAISVQARCDADDGADLPCAGVDGDAVGELQHQLR
jgi:hypothetical protein